MNNEALNKALIASLEGQRNAAFNALANSQAALAVANAEIAALRAALPAVKEGLQAPEVLG